MVIHQNTYAIIILHYDYILYKLRLKPRGLYVAYIIHKRISIFIDCNPQTVLVRRVVKTRYQNNIRE